MPDSIELIEVQDASKAFATSQSECPPITTGDLSRLIDPGMGVKLTVRFVCELGFTPVPKPSVLAGSGTYWRAADVPWIIEALSNHLASVYAKL